jgi:hypothetical protein
MIVRIFTEGQYELREEALDGLRELDDAAQAAIDARDEQSFHDVYGRLLEHIRERGTPLAGDDLRPSELMLPPPDIELAEAAREFHGHGLIAAADEELVV